MIEKLNRLRVDKYITSSNKRQYIVWFLGKCSYCGSVREYRESNLRTQKSCGCVTTKPKFFGTNSCKKLFYNGLRQNAKSRGHPEPTITFEEAVFIAENNCFYCGKYPEMLTHNKTSKKGTYKPWLRNGIDRLDSKIGYTIANSVPCCKLCNLMKNKLELSEFVDHVSKIFRYLEV